MRAARPLSVTLVVQPLATKDANPERVNLLTVLPFAHPSRPGREPPAATSAARASAWTAVSFFVVVFIKPSIAARPWESTGYRSVHVDRFTARHGSYPDKHGWNNDLSVAAMSTWPTPTANDATGSTHTYDRGNHEKKILKLAGAAKLATWPTPQSRDGAGGRGGQAERHFRPGSPRNLDDTVMLASWVTPAANEARGTPEQFLERKRKTRLKGNHCGVSLTSLNLQIQLVGSGPTPNGSPAGTASTGQLNPEFSLWLQGYPAAWGSCAVQATRSVRRRPRSSLGPT